MSDVEGSSHRVWSKHGNAMTLTFEQVEQWLDEHYDLAEDYFVRKASARMVKLWQEATRVRCEREKSNLGLDESTISSVIGDKESALKAKQCHFNNSVEILNSNECEDECGEARPHRRLSEPHRQPTTQRQFSADERKRQLLYSKSIPSTFFQSLDLNLSTLSEFKEEKIKRVKSPPRQLRKTKSLPNCGQQHVLGALIESKVRLPSSKSLNKESKLDLKNNNEREFFFEIVRDIANDLDLKTLSYKILVNVGILTNADRCSLFLVEGPKGKQWLVSKVFDVQVGSTSSSAPKDAIDHQREIRVPFGVGLVGYAAATGETVNIPDAYADPRFNQDVDKQTGYHTKSLLCKPVKNNEGEVVGVAQIINKNPGGVPFTREDEKVCDMYLTFCGIGITNAKLFELSTIEFNRNRALLELVHDIFEEQTSLENVVHKIMKRALSLLKCEKCSVLLLGQPVLGSSSAEHRAQELRFSSVFNLKVTSPKHPGSTIYSEGHDDRSFTSRIAKFVSAVGKTVIIPDALQDVRVRKILSDSSDGDKKDFTSILCMPIRNNKFEIIGVAEVINKLDNKPFDENDETLFEAFAIFCGLGIHNTMIYDQMARAKAKQQVALEVLSYHVAAKKSEVEKIVTSRIPTSEELNLYSFTFDDFSLGADEMLIASIRMFKDSGFIEAFNVDYETLGRWILTVKNNYRNVIYHNWRHAFNVAQSMFAMLQTGEMSNYLSKLECLGLLVGCLCHDLDHRGTNNAFQAKTDTPLSKLYGTSTMEHHHFNHAVIILSTEGHNIFQRLSADEYRQVISYIKHSILSTDLAVNFKQRPKFFALVENEQFDPKNMDHRDMLKAMMMTACDLNGTTKPWEIQKGVVNLVTREFFEQGDLERERLNVEPLAIMDRQRIDELPKMQVQFFESTGIPVFKILAKINNNLKPLVNGAEDNKSRWHEINESRKKTYKS